MFDALSPADRELDLLTLSVQVFGPLLAAGLVLLTPRRFPELTRWVAVVLAAALVTLGLCRFIDYYTILDSYSDRTVTSLYHPAATLESRSDQQAADAARAVPKPYRSDDLFARRPWAARLDLDYALGVDAPGLAVTLLAALATLAAAVASFRHDTRLRPTLALGFVLQTAATGAALAVDLALTGAFLGLAAAAVALLLAPAGALGARYTLTALAGSVAFLTAVFTLHQADTRDFVDAGVHDSRAADARQADPRLTPEVALERTPVHSFDPVTLSKFVRAASLIHRGDSNRVTAKRQIAQLPRPGDDVNLVPLYAPGVDAVAATERVQNQSIGTRPARATVLILLAVAAACGLGLFPAHGWLADALARLPAPAAIALAGAAWPLAGMLTLRLLVMLAPGTPDVWRILLGTLGLVSLLAAFVAGLRTTDLARLAAAQLTAAGGLALVGLGARGDSPEAWEQGVAGAALVVIGAAVPAMMLVWLAAALRTRLGHADLVLAGPLATRAPGLAALTDLALLLGSAIPGGALFIGSLAALTASLSAGHVTGFLATLLTLALAARRLALAATLASRRTADTREVPDLAAGEWLPLAGLALLTIVFGVAPSLVFVWIDPSIQGLVQGAIVVR